MTGTTNADDTSNGADEGTGTRGNTGTRGDTGTRDDHPTRSDTATRDRSRDAPRRGDPAVRTYLFRGALAVLGLVAVVALFGFYQSVNDVIDVFIDGRYRPVFRAAFNLVVLLSAGIGISWTVRELSE